jgi:nuclear RNA export factor
MTSEMAQSSGSGSNINFRRKKAMRKGSPIPRSNIGGRLMQHQSGWYLVTLQQGNKYEKNTLLKLLLNAVSPTNFQAHYYKIDNDNNYSQFYVDDYDVAQTILRQDKKIDLPNGFKLSIRVRGSLPITRIDDNLKERMKMAMVKRYNAQTKAMDLTKFHADPDLADIFCALFRPPILIAVIDIISENIPDLEALNLNENKLNVLDHMKVITNKLPNIKILYLANNKVKLF